MLQREKSVVRVSSRAGHRTEPTPGPLDDPSHRTPGPLDDLLRGPLDDLLRGPLDDLLRGSSERADEGTCEPREAKKRPSGISESPSAIGGIRESPSLPRDESAALQMASSHAGVSSASWGVSGGVLGGTRASSGHGREHHPARGGAESPSAGSQRPLGALVPSTLGTAVAPSRDRNSSVGSWRSEDPNPNHDPDLNPDPVSPIRPLPA